MADANADKPMMAVLNHKRPSRRPIWMMRQAGRYLPEYRDVRAQAGSFLDLCYAPELAAEVTFQPLRRFDLDAAILFADILLVPHALGVELAFEEGRGPILKSVRSSEEVKQLQRRGMMKRLAPVLETVDRVVSGVDKHITVIGFCGAPWTVASYMIEGGTSSDRRRARTAASLCEPWFCHLIEVLVEASAAYLVAQLRAGAEVVQIFESWAGDLGAIDFRKWSIQPVARIVELVRGEIPDAKIIGFPRKAGLGIVDFASETGVSGLGLDETVSRQTMKSLVSDGHIVQGNVDPVRLAAGGRCLMDDINDIVKNVSVDKHIMNLGHGVFPDTSPDNVEMFIDHVRYMDSNM